MCVCLPTRVHMFICIHSCCFALQESINSSIRSPLLEWHLFAEKSFLFFGCCLNTQTPLNPARTVVNLNFALKMLLLLAQKKNFSFFLMSGQSLWVLGLAAAAAAATYHLNHVHYRLPSVGASFCSSAAAASSSVDKYCQCLKLFQIRQHICRNCVLPALAALLLLLLLLLPNWNCLNLGQTVRLTWLAGWLTGDHLLFWDPFGPPTIAVWFFNLLKFSQADGKQLATVGVYCLV